MMTYKSQVLKTSYVSIVVLLVILALNLFGLNQIVHSNIWSVYLLSVAVAFIVAFYNGFAMNQSKDNFVPLMLGSVVLRMFLSIVAILILLLTIEENILLLVVSFMLIYLCFMAFEIYSIITNLRPFSGVTNLNDKNSKSEHS